MRRFLAALALAVAVSAPVHAQVTLPWPLPTAFTTVDPVATPVVTWHGRTLDMNFANVFGGLFSAVDPLGAILRTSRLGRKR